VWLKFASRCFNLCLLQGFVDAFEGRVAEEATTRLTAEFCIHENSRLLPIGPWENSCGMRNGVFARAERLEAIQHPQLVLLRNFMGSRPKIVQGVGNGGG
jgi:hypothetical protein